MTGRIILGVVLALILLFLFSNVRLVFRYDNGEVFLQARWLFIRYQILPEPEKRKKKGAGDEKKESTKIGLKTCKKIIEQMNGRLYVKENKNSFTVSFCLPFAATSEDLQNINNS